MADQAAPQEEQEKRTDPFELFSEQVRIPVYGLTFIGHITKDVHYCGHVFQLRTLYPAEKAAVSLVIKEWRETISEGEVWANAQVALALTSVDNDADFCPAAGPDLVEHAKGRLNFATKQWHQTTLGFLYARYLELEQEALNGIRELQDLSERNRDLLQPSPDSLTEQGTSDDATDGDTQI